MGLVQKSFSDIITFSRSSNATRVGPNGLIQYAPHNLLLYSQELDNAAWSASATAIVRTANTTTAPDGTVTADSWLGDGTTAVHYSGQLVTLSSTLTYAFSFYAKANGVNFVQVILGSGTGYANFDITAGAGVVGTSASPFSSLSIQDVGNNWYRCSCIITNSAASNIYFALSNSASALRAASSFSTSNGIYLWGAQLAVGPLALDYTPTTTAAVYGPRFDYDGSGVTSVDPIARNLLTYSQEFDNAAWVKSNGSVSANASTAPDGTLSADKFVENSTASVHSIINTIGAAQPAGAYCYSIYVKADGRSQVLIQNTITTTYGATFDLTALTVLSTTNATGSIVDVGNGWRRCTFTFTSSTSITFNFAVYPLVSGSGFYQGDGTSGLLLWGAQLEVGSTATGYMVSGATNGFRAVPVVTGNATARGLLVEEQRTNLLTYSEQFDNAAWTKTNATVTANATTSPDGTVNAYLLLDDTTNGLHRIRNLFPAVLSSVYTMSLFIKAGTSTVNVGLLFGSGFGEKYVVVNPATGDVIGTGSATATVTAFGNGWYRITATATSDVTGTASAQIYICDTAPVSRVGNGTGHYIWGAQLEAGAFATSYIPTLASTVTRSADVASVNTLSPWFNATEGTLYVETVSKNVLGTSKLPAALNSAAYATNSISPFIYSTARLRLLIYAGGVITGDMYPATVYSDNQTIKFGAAYKLNDFALSANGATPTTDTSGDVPTGIDRLDLGVTAGLTTFSGWLNRVAYYPRRLTNAELQALSA